MSLVGQTLDIHLCRPWYLELKYFWEELQRVGLRIQGLQKIGWFSSRDQGKDRCKHYLKFTDGPRQEMYIVKKIGSVIVS